MLRFDDVCGVFSLLPRMSPKYPSDFFNDFLSESLLVVSCCVIMRQPQATHSNPRNPPRIFQKLAKKATRNAKAKFDDRIARKKQRQAQKGQANKVYYTTSVKVTEDGQVKRQFTGGKDLQSTAAYPTRFCTAVCQLWAQAYAAYALSTTGAGL